MTDQPKIKALAPWFGGKRSLAPVIVKELGQHRSYWEPCVGGFGVIMAKPRSSHEVVNDLHGDAINLAMVVASDHAPKLYDRAQRTMVTEAVVRHAMEAMKEPIASVPASPFAVQSEHVDRAYLYFTLSWAGRNGVSGSRRTNYQVAVRWTHGGGSSAGRFVSAVESLPAWHQRLRKVEILNRDMFDVIDKIEDESGTAIYIDPPYLRQGARRGNNQYLHEFQADDHRRLTESVKRFEFARVVISYYDDPLLDELYAGWTKRCVYRSKNLHVQNRRGSTKTEAPEILLMNGPSFVDAIETTDASTPLFAKPIEKASV